MLGLDLLAALTFSLVASSHQYELSQAEWMSQARYTHTQLRRGPDYAGVQQYRRPIVKTRHPVDWCAPGACPFMTVWSLDEASGQPRLNDRDSICGAACDLSDLNTVGQDTTNFLEGSAAALFVNADDDELFCTDGNCGGTTRLDFPDDITWGAWARFTDFPEDIRFAGKFSSFNVQGYQAEFATAGTLRCGISGTSLSTNFFGGLGATTNDYRHLVCRFDDTANTIEGVADGVAQGSPTSFTQDCCDNTVAAQLSRPGRTLEGQQDETFMIGQYLSIGQLCRMCACQIDGKKCACDSATPTSYASCSTDADCAGEALCSTGNLCEGRRVSECSSCTLPSCNVAAP
jgi:hypothetical protein